METTNHDQMDELLKQLRHHTAPAGLKDGVMSQIKLLSTIPARKTIDAEKWLLLTSLVAGMAAIFFAIDFDFVVKGITALMQQFGRMISQESSLNTLVNTSAQLPVLALTVILAMSTLLLLERLFLRRFLSRYLNFLI